MENKLSKFLGVSLMAIDVFLEPFNLVDAYNVILHGMS